VVAPLVSLRVAIAVLKVKEKAWTAGALSEPLWRTAA
jgi:hypothetical protein